MGGVQYSTLYLAEQLIKQKSINLRILLPFEGRFSALCRKNSIPYNIYEPIPYISTSISFLNDKIRIPNIFALAYNIYLILINSRKIRVNIKLYSPNIVVTKGFLNHLSGGLASKKLQIPIIWHLQDLVTDRYFSFNKHILNYLANRIADYIICDGQIIKEALRGPILNRTFVVLNGIKTDDLKRCSKARIETRRELGIPVNAYVIGHLARIKPWKGQGNLLNAFIDYSKENLNSYLILAGSPLFGKDKYYRYLKEIIIKNNLENRVSMPGYRSDLGNLFSAMDFFVYPSIEKDTSPLALLSALCSGLPVAMSQIDSLKDVVSNCPSIDLFNVDDNDNLVRLMEKYENPILRNKNGIKNKKYAKYNFNISNHTKHITKIFKTI